MKASRWKKLGEAALRLGSLAGERVRGLLLIETDSIGAQCLKTTFSKFFHPRAERVARVNLAARARTDAPRSTDSESGVKAPRPRPDSIAWLRTDEYHEKSTSLAVI